MVSYLHQLYGCPTRAPCAPHQRGGERKAEAKSRSTSPISATSASSSRQGAVDRQRLQRISTADTKIQTRQNGACALLPSITHLARERIAWANPNGPKSPQRLMHFKEALRPAEVTKVSRVARCTKNEGLALSSPQFLLGHKVGFGTTTASPAKIWALNSSPPSAVGCRSLREKWRGALMARCRHDAAR